MFLRNLFAYLFLFFGTEYKLISIGFLYDVSVCNEENDFSVTVVDFTFDVFIFWYISLKFSESVLINMN